MCWDCDVDPKAKELTDKMRVGLDPWKTPIGDRDITAVISTVPKNDTEARELLRKFNSTASEMNRVLKEGMSGHGFQVSFDESGAFLIGRKGKTIKTDDYVKVTRKLRNYGRRSP